EASKIWLRESVKHASNDIHAAIAELDEYFLVIQNQMEWIQSRLGNLDVLSENVNCSRDTFFGILGGSERGEEGYKMIEEEIEKEKMMLRVRFGEVDKGQKVMQNVREWLEWGDG